jgi:hypothetical protein
LVQFHKVNSGGVDYEHQKDSTLEAAQTYQVTRQDAEHADPTATWQKQVGEGALEVELRDAQVGMGSRALEQVAYLHFPARRHFSARIHGLVEGRPCLGADAGGQ